MNEQFKQVALRWLELRDSPGARPSLDAFCAAEFPGHTAQQKSLLIQLDRFDEALQHWIEPNKEEAPNIVGYNFLDQIAVGGMGVVWRAYEDRLCRVLAVKVMKQGLRDHPPSIASFQSEAQLTARLAHPNLVPIHELGVCQDGRYFYSMKLVEGQTLAEKLRRPDEIVTQRMALLKVFSQICQGVAFAHKQSIIHRDLKPENIMLGAQGEVQVMDWGLALDLNQKHPRVQIDSTNPKTFEFLGEEMVCGTRGYMSPEQASCVAIIDCRSDVFALGVMLCELLTGALPTGLFETDGMTLNSTIMDNLRAKFKTQAVDNRLGNLALRCLATNPADRPKNAGDVGAELDQYLYGVEQERRRRKLVSQLAFVAVLAALVMLMGLLEFQSLWKSEHQARIAADDSRQRTRRILDEWSRAVVDEWLDLRPDELTPDRRALVESMQAHYERLIEESDNSPEMLSACAKGLRRIGQMRVINNDLDGAAAPLERAQQLVEQQLSKFPNQEALLADLAQVLHIQGAMFDSQHPPQFNEARASYEKSIAILRRLTATDPSPTYCRKLARGCISQAFVLRSLNHRAAALEMIQDAIQILEELLVRSPDEWLPHEDLASALNIRYLIFSDLGEMELAGTSLLRGIGIRESLAQSHPDFQKNSIRLGINYGNYGKFVHINGHVERAMEFYDRATGRLEPIFRRNQDLPECRNALRNIYSRRAIAFEQLGNPEAAVRNWESAIRIELAPRRQILNARLALAKNEPMEAVELVRTYRDREGISSEELFDCGRVFARASQLFADDQVRAEYEREAIKMVDQALARGYSVINKNDHTFAHDFARMSLWSELQKRFSQ